MTNKTHTKEILSDYSVKDWIHWLDCRFSGRLEEIPLLGPPQEIHHEINSIYSDLTSNASRSRLSEAVYRVLDGTPLSVHSVERLYYLLQLVSLMKHPLAKNLLSRLVVSELLTPFEFGEQNLHYLALHTYCTYSLEEPIIRYIKRSCFESGSSLYRLLCMRLLFLRSTEDGLSLLAHVLEIADSEIEKIRVGFQIREAIERWGGTQFVDLLRGGLGNNVWTGNIVEFFRAYVVPWNQKELFSEEMLFLAAYAADRGQVRVESIVRAIEPIENGVDDVLIKATVRELFSRNASRPQGIFKIDPKEYPQIFRALPPEESGQVAIVTSPGIVQVPSESRLASVVSQINVEDLQGSL